MVLVEPRGPGMALITLRAADEVRAADFTGYAGELDAEAVAIATMIINRKAGTFDRYQEALRDLIEAKIKGLPIRQQPAAAPAAVFDLMCVFRSIVITDSGGR
jgi:DNA end-binding protein Ku